MLRRASQTCAACRSLARQPAPAAATVVGRPATRAHSTLSPKWTSTASGAGVTSGKPELPGNRPLVLRSDWKGKGRETGLVHREQVGYTLAKAAFQVRRKSTSAATHAPPAYAHEDLLSKTKRSSDDIENPPPSTSSLVPTSSHVPSPHPPTVLANGLPNPLIRWRPRPIPTLKDDLEQYQKLGKFRLTVLVTLTAMAGYAMCPLDPSSATVAMDAFAQSLSASLPPGAAIEVPQLTTPPSSLTSDPYGLVLAPVTVGVVLCSAAAASFNQLIEAPYDAQMARTRGRPLPRRYMTPLNAVTFGGITGVIGLGTLYAINPLSAAIGLSTILLYCPLYTIAKRHTIYNTWLGAVVGGLPPLLGWAACTDSIDPVTQPGAWAMFALLFFWQFPHFNALAHTVRASYASSGYRMLSALDPAKNALVALRYSLAMIPLAFTFPVLGMTYSIFPWLALVPNGAMSWAAFRFWRRRTERNAKVLFWASLGHLSIFLVLAMACKKGLWDRWTGEEAEKDKDVET